MRFPIHHALLLALLAGPLGATPAPREPQESIATQESTARGRAHVIHFANGQIFRGRARQVDEAWEIWENRTWRRLPAQLVERAVPEHELERRASKLERELPKSDQPDANTKRAAYADWLIREGLHQEGLAQLERILAVDPDQLDARRVLAASPFRLARPELQATEGPELETFLRDCAGAGAVKREAILGDLEARVQEGAKHTAAASHLETALFQDLENSSPRRRSFATHALRRLFPLEDARPFLTRALLDPSADVRTGAARALRDIGDEAVALPVLRALGSGSERVREHAIEALGTMDYAAAVPTLVHHLTTTLQSSRGGSAGAPRSNIFVGRQFAYVQDFDVEIAQAQSIADPVINVLAEGNALEAAVLGVSEYVLASERAATRRSLSNLTGATPGNTTAAWKRWWEENGDEWTKGTPPTSPTSPTSPGK